MLFTPSTCVKISARSSGGGPAGPLAGLRRRDDHLLELCAREDAEAIERLAEPLFGDARRRADDRAAVEIERSLAALREEDQLAVPCRLRRHRDDVAER